MLTGAAPYFRIGYEERGSEQNYHVGAFAFFADLYPGGDQTTKSTSDRYSDLQESTPAINSPGWEKISSPSTQNIYARRPDIERIVVAWFIRLQRTLSLRRFELTYLTTGAI